jgi:hypothetical protein
MVRSFHPARSIAVTWVLAFGFAALRAQLVSPEITPSRPRLPSSLVIESV